MDGLFCESNLGWFWKPRKSKYLCGIYRGPQSMAFPGTTRRLGRPRKLYGDGGYSGMRLGFGVSTSRKGPCRYT